MTLFRTLGISMPFAASSLILIMTSLRAGDAGHVSSAQHLRTMLRPPARMLGVAAVLNAVALGGTPPSQTCMGFNSAISRSNR